MSVFGHINKLIAGPLFAIFLALIFGALTVFGVINMTFGHLLLFAAWLVGGILIATEILPGKPAKHKIPIILLLGVAILGLDRWVVSLKAAEEAKKAVTPVAEAQKQTPIQTKTQANASPTASASASPSIVAHASPKPQASPPVSVPINFDRVIFITQK